MALKWVGALVAAAALAAFTTANVMASDVSVALNLALVAAWTAGLVLLVAGELYRRLDHRLDLLSDFVVARSEEILARLDALQLRNIEAPLTSLERLTLAPVEARPASARMEGYVPKRR